jgi:hypothetical protein
MESNNKGSYDLADKNPVAGEDQYRLKLVDLSNNVTYSNVATLFYMSVPGNSVNLSIFPNPTSSTINLSIAQENKMGNFKIDSYDVKIVNLFGVVVKQGTSHEASWHASIGDLQPGTYMVQVTNSNSKNLIGVTSFVKD